MKEKKKYILRLRGNKQRCLQLGKNKAWKPRSGKPLKGKRKIDTHARTCMCTVCLQRCVFMHICIHVSASECVHVCSESFQWYSTLLTCITDSSVHNQFCLFSDNEGPREGRLAYRRFPRGHWETIVGRYAAFAEVLWIFFHFMVPCVTPADKWENSSNRCPLLYWFSSLALLKEVLEVFFSPSILNFFHHSFLSMLRSYPCWFQNWFKVHSWLWKQYHKVHLVSILEVLIGSHCSFCEAVTREGGFLFCQAIKTFIQSCFSCAFVVEKLY